MFKSKVSFLSEKKVYLSRSSCFDKVVTQILYPKNCSKYLENEIADIAPNVWESKKGASVKADCLCGGFS